MTIEDRKMQWRELGLEKLSNSFLKLVRWRGQYERFDGDWSDVIEREMVLRGDAVAVLAIDLALDAVLLVRQFRIGAANQPGGAWQDEILAGAVEPGEALEDVARREAAEEAGLILDELVSIARYQPSPGGSDETIHIFLAPISLEGAGGVFGLNHENEDILASVVPVDEVLAALDAGRFNNSKTVIALQWLALQRARGHWRAQGDG